MPTALATGALVAILEAGAVAAKLATLVVRSGKAALTLMCIAALSVNAVANGIYGAAVGASNGLSGAGLIAGAVVYAALVPALAFLMLVLFCRRVEALRDERNDVQRQVEAQLAPVAHTVESFLRLASAMREIQQAMPQLGAPAAPATVLPLPNAPQLAPPQPVAPATQPHATEPAARNAPVAAPAASTDVAPVALDPAPGEAAQEAVEAAHKVGMFRAPAALYDTYAAIIAALDSDPRLRTATLEQATGKAARTVETRRKELVEAGVLVRDGDGYRKNGVKLVKE